MTGDHTGTTLAAEWHVDPDRIGVVEFFAGTNLAALLSTHFDYQGKTVPASTVIAPPSVTAPAMAPAKACSPPWPIWA